MQTIMTKWAAEAAAIHRLSNSVAGKPYEGPLFYRQVLEYKMTKT